MSKERALRRAARLAEADAARAARERARRRRERRRAALRRLRWPRGGRPDRRTGRLFARRPPGQRAAIVTTALGVLGLTWLLVEPLAVQVGITALVAVTAPALVVLTFDRRI